MFSFPVHSRQRTVYNEMVKEKQGTLNLTYNSIESSVAEETNRVSPVTVDHEDTLWTAPNLTLTEQVFTDPELLTLFKDC